MNRVVVTGMGVIAPNALGLQEYAEALKTGRSGIRYIEKLRDLNFSCQVGGVCQDLDKLKTQYFTTEQLMAMNESLILAGIAGLECWKDAGFASPLADSEVDWDTGAIIGTGIGGVDTIGEKLIGRVDAKQVRRLGSTLVEQTMCSAVSAKLGGLLGLGGQVTTNSSACTTGTEAIVNGFLKVKNGESRRMMAGGAESSSCYTWAGFDGMRVLNSKSNEFPEKASRPMSASAAGFVPGSGCGILMVENLESARARGARIYAEIIGGHVNSGGQRNGGSMTAPNPEGVVRCIRKAMSMAGVQAQDIDGINGHLTATFADRNEIENWLKALESKAEEFPLIQSTKSLIGHALGAAGGLECVAVVLQLHQSFFHGSLNCEDLHPGLQMIAKSVVRKTCEFRGKIIAKSSFGFGDVNGCVLFKKWDE